MDLAPHPERLHDQLCHKQQLLRQVRVCVRDYCLPRLSACLRSRPLDHPRPS